MKTAEELDKELDLFMHDDSKPKPSGKEGGTAETVPSSQVDGDIEMAT